MTKLTIVTDAWTPQINGVVTTMTNIVSKLQNREFDVNVIHPGLFKTVPLPTYPSIKIAIDVWRLLPLISKTDAVHIVTEGPLGIAARILCTVKRWRYTTGFHTNFPEYLYDSYGVPHWITRPLFKWFHRKSSAVFVPSKSTAQKLYSQGFRNLVVWSRGYDEKIFNPHCVDYDLMPEDKINLLYVGRLSKEKNIEAFLNLARPGYRLWVVGEGPDRLRLQEVTRHAYFVGFKTGPDLADYYRAADVFVFPSKTDTLGIVSIEAMACGTPVAAYNVEGPRDVVIEGIGGALDDDLSVAVERALKLRANVSVTHNAEMHTWGRAADTFIACLVKKDGSTFK